MFNLNKNHYRINDIVMFYNTYNGDLSSKKCPKCLGSRKIYYKDENQDLKSSNCSCYFGYVYDKGSNFSDKQFKVSFGVITRIKLYPDGRCYYDIDSSINPYGSLAKKEVLGYFKFFSNENNYFDFPIDGHSTISYSVSQSNIIKSCSKFSKEYGDYEILDYEYIFNKKDIVYWSSTIFIEEYCKLCNDKKIIDDINGKSIPCPKHNGNVRLGHNESILVYGEIQDLYLEIDLVKDTESYLQPKIKQRYVLEITSGIGINGVKAKNSFNNLYPLSKNCTLTKNLEEALILLDQKKD